MGEETGGAVLRAWGLVLVALAVWALTVYAGDLPTALPADAPTNLFSATRAEAVLARLLGPERPHPASSAENAAVRARILNEYATLGIKATTYRALGCNLSRGYGVMECGTVTDVMADVRPGQGKAVVLLAHYDSVPAGPGASDDESGDATIFETIRALKAKGDSGLHPIVALHTDGEEFGLLGAASALDDAQFRARVGAVVNVEARGNQGPSLLFQTSPGDAPLIDLYARAVPRVATSSLFSVIYKLLPNDTDLTLFINRGFTSFNFAFSGNVAHYHTALDRRENLDPRTLQMQGDNMLGVVSALEHTDFKSLRGGKDDVYIALFGRFLPRMPAAWALPLAIFVFVLLIASMWLERIEPQGWGRRIASLSIVPLFVLGAAALGWALHETASLVSGQPDPSYAYPLCLRISLAFGVWCIALLVSRLAPARAAALGVWLFIGLLAVITAQFVPGLSPYFLFPAAIAAPIVFLQVFLPRPWSGPRAQIALLLAALPMLFIWMTLVVTGETVMGLALHPLFTVPAAFALSPLVPLLAASSMPRPWWLGSAGLSFAIALGCAVGAGLQPAFSEKAPQRLDISYVEDATQHRAFWTADARAPLPPSLRAAADFSAEPVKPYPIAFFDAYTAKAGVPRFAPPTATVSVSPGPDGARRVSLALHGTGEAAQMVLVVPRSAGLKAVDIDGKHFDAPAEWAKIERGAIILCTTRDCADKTITLTLAAKKPVDITLVEQRYGLPPGGAKLQAARPKTAIVSQNGDVTVLINAVKVPGA